RPRLPRTGTPGTARARRTGAETTATKDHADDQNEGRGPSMSPRLFRSRSTPARPRSEPGLLQTVPGRLRALTAVALLSLVLVFRGAGAAIRDAQEALRTIGHDKGQTVVAASDITLALSDMDAQVTDVLLTGREDGWLCDPAQMRQDTPSCVREYPRYFYDL